MEPRIGRQTPTTSVVLPYDTTWGDQAIELYESTGRHALEWQKMLIREFQKWVWKDPARKKRLETIFENQYSCMRRRIYDGSYLTFPGMDKSVELYPYQKNAVARILFSPNTLLAHDVGSGKTYIMIAAGQELRRMKLSKNRWTSSRPPRVTNSTLKCPLLT